MNSLELATVEHSLHGMEPKNKIHDRSDAVLITSRRKATRNTPYLVVDVCFAVKGRSTRQRLSRLSDRTGANPTRTFSYAVKQTLADAVTGVQ